MSTHMEVAAAVAKDQRDRWTRELTELEARIDTLKLSHKPVRAEMERLGKMKLALMRKLGML